MKQIFQYIHYPNLTELGKGNTSDTYFLVSKDMNDVEALFPNKVEQEFIEPLTQKHYKLKAVIGNEFRVNQLGPFYREYDVHYGDAVICTKISDSNEDKLYISTIKGCHTGFIVSKRLGVEVIEGSNLSGFVEKSEIPLSFQVNYKGQIKNIEIMFDKSVKKRKDSPAETDFYICTLDGHPMSHDMVLDIETMTLRDYKKAEYNMQTW